MGYKFSPLLYDSNNKYSKKVMDDDKRDKSIAAIALSK